MCSVINDICNKQGNTIILGDCNYLHINWNTWNSSGTSECAFVNVLRKFF